MKPRASRADEHRTLRLFACTAHCTVWPLTEAVSSNRSLYPRLNYVRSPPRGPNRSTSHGSLRTKGGRQIRLARRHCTHHRSLKQTSSLITPVGQTLNDYSRPIRLAKPRPAGQKSGYHAIVNLASSLWPTADKEGRRTATSEQECAKEPSGEDST